MAYFDSYNVEYSDDKKNLVKCPRELSGSYFVLDGTEIIKSDAFVGCKSITKITLPVSLKTIERNSFTNAKSISEIRYNGTIEQWMLLNWEDWIENGHTLYVDGTLLTDLVIPKTIKVVKKAAFYYCKSLRSISFHDEIESIENSAFNKSAISGELVLPEGLTSIKPFAFFNCIGLTSVVIPNSLNDLWYGSFGCCSKLGRFKIHYKNDNFYADEMGLYDRINHSIKAVSLSGHKQPMTFPDWVTEIASDTFCYDDIPHGGLYLTRNVKVINKEAFLKTENIRIYVFEEDYAYFEGLGIESKHLRRICNPNMPFKEGHNRLQIISNNPFRIIGAYSDATSKEITSNTRKIQRYLEVGKPISFGIDSEYSYGEIQRSNNTINDAIAKLSSPIERVKHAIFWPVNHKPLRQEFAKDLQELYDSGTTISFADGFKCWFDRHDEMIKAFIDGNFIKATFEAFELFPDDLWVKSISNGIEISKADLMHIFLNVLMEDCENISILSLLRYVQAMGCDNHTLHNDSEKMIADAITYLRDETFKQISTNIQHEVRLAKNVDSDNSEGSLVAANKLIENTRQSVKVLQNEYADDTQTSIILDTLANQILQSSINYYNASIARSSAFTAIKLTKVAISLAVGQRAKDRCEENMKILSKIASKLPPVGAEEDDDELNAICVKYMEDSPTVDLSMQILREAAPYIVHIKEVAGELKEKDDREQIEIYLNKISSLVLNLSLSKLIDAVNAAIENSYSGRGTILKAWDVVLNIDRFPMEQKFKEDRYKPNRNTLEKLVKQVKGFGNNLYSVSAFVSVLGQPDELIDLRSSEEVWKDCDTLEELQYFVGRFPKSKHFRTAQNRIAKIEKEREDRFWDKAKQDENYDSYLETYPRGIYVAEAKLLKKAKLEREDDECFSNCESAQDFITYLSKYPNGRNVTEAEQKRDQKIQEETKTWENCKSREDIKNYLSKYPNGIYKTKADKRLDVINKQAKLFKWTIYVEILVILLLVAHLFLSHPNFVGACICLCLLALISVLTVFIFKRK